MSMELTMEILEACYRAGAFPMADAYGRIEFYRSDPRSVLEFEDLHVPRSLGRVIRKRTFEVRVDEDFDGVIRACADREETWINPEISTLTSGCTTQAKPIASRRTRMGISQVDSTGSPSAARSWASRCSPEFETPPKSAWSTWWIGCRSGVTYFWIARSRTPTSPGWGRVRSPNRSTSGACGTP